MTHINLDLARKRCTPDELEIVIARNYTPPLSWSMIGAATGRSRGVVRRMWGEANRKVNGGYVPPAPSRVETGPLPAGYVAPKPRNAADDRATRATDPDVRATWAGVPFAGVRGAIRGTKPDQITRSGK